MEAAINLPSASAQRLGLLTLIGASLVSFTADLTEDARAQAQAQQLQARLQSVLTTQVAADLQPRRVDHPLLASLPVRRYQVHCDTIVLEVVSDEGYNGKIALLVGISAGPTIHAVTPLQHTETPGLGDRIEPERSDWIAQFSQTRLEPASNSRWALKKYGGEFDQLTGATITSRAVIKALHNALIYTRDIEDLSCTNNDGAQGAVK